MGTPANVLVPEAPAADANLRAAVRAVPRRGATQDWNYESLLEAVGKAHGKAKFQAELGLSPAPDRHKPAFSVLSR